LFIRAGQYKSRRRVLAGIFFRSRDSQAERARRKAEEIEELRRDRQHVQRDLASAQEKIADIKIQIVQLKIDNQQRQSVTATARAAARPGTAVSRIRTEDNQCVC
jgi:chromosome segregation ATPase